MVKKVTYTLDDATIRRIEQSSERLGKPKSEIVREAVEGYFEHLDRLGESERLRLLRAFDELVPAIPARSAAAVDREIRAIRSARRSGGRGRS